MGLLRLVARPMLASIFVRGGIQQLTDPAGHVPVAEDVTAAIKDATDGNLPQVEDTDAEQLVQLHGLAQVIGGLLLTFGKFPRLAALLLAGSIVPTTLAAHRFWEEDDAESKQQQQVQFFKNVSLLGGLLIATTDREGRPSLKWRSGHAVDHAKLATEHAAELTRLKAELAKEKAGRKAATAVTPDRGENLRLRKELAKEKAGRKTATAVTPDRGENLRLRKELAKEKAGRKTDRARAKAAKAGAKAAVTASPDRSENVRLRKELAKKKLTPDAKDAKRLVSAMRSDD